MSTSLEEWLSEQPEPVVTEDHTPQREPFWRRVNWSNWILIAVVAVWLVSTKVDCDRGIVPDDGDAVVIDEEGRFALILVDETPSGRDALTRDQAAAINSADTLLAAKQAGFTVRTKHYEEDLSSIGPVWSKMQSVALPPPSLTLVSDGKVVREKIKDKSTTINTIRGVKQ